MQIVAQIRYGRSRDAATAIALIVGIGLGGLLGHMLPLRSGPVAVAQGTAPSSDRLDADHETILSVIRLHRGSEDARTSTLADAIYRESLQAEIDPLLVTSIVAKESSFRSRVVSRAGAVGLMQLRPWVARDLAERNQLEWNGLDTLHDPSLNVRLGISYYKELVERFDGDEHKALAAYNRGPSRLSHQLRRGTYLGSRYAESILGFYEQLSASREPSNGSPLVGAAVTPATVGG